MTFYNIDFLNAKDAFHCTIWPYGFHLSDFMCIYCVLKPNWTCLVTVYCWAVARRGFMTGEAPVARWIPVSDTWPAFCGRFLPNKYCVHLRKQLNVHRLKKKKEWPVLPFIGFARLLTSLSFLWLYLGFTAGFRIQEHKQDNTVYTQQTVHYISSSSAQNVH